MKKVFSIIAIMMVTISALAKPDRPTVAFSTGNFSYCYSSVSGCVKVCGCSLSGSVTLPSKVVHDGKEYIVLTIAPYAFEDNTSITVLTIPSSIEWIENNAFTNATGLKKVVFADGDEVLHVGYDQGYVVTPDDEIFYKCSNLTECYLGRTLTINNNDVDKPFQGTNLQKLTVGPGARSIPNYLCQGSKLTTLDMSKATNLEYIYKNAFQDCDGFATADFSGCKSLKKICAEAFHDCDNCTTIDLSQCTALEEICSEAFCNMDKLESVDLSNCSALKYIDDNAFLNNSLLNYVSFMGCISLESIGVDAFNDADKLTVADLSQCTKLKTLKDQAFFGCDGLKAVKLPPSLESVGEDCFDRAATYSSTVRSVYFYGDSNSKDRVLSNKDIDNFDEATFIYLDRIVKNTDGSKPFPKCMSVVLGGHMSKISSGLFSDNENLKEISLTTSAGTVIEGSAFSNCSKLVSVTLLGNIKVNKNAFSGDTGINQIIINDEVELQDYAFASSKKTIYVNYSYSHSPQTVQNEAFNDASRSNTLIIQCGSYYASDELPWSLYSNQGYITTSKIDIDRTSETAITGQANIASMNLCEGESSVFMTRLPFTVSSYYFGPDAAIYQLDVKASHTADGIANLCLQRLDLDCMEVLPTGVSLLVINKHHDTELKGTLSLFERDDIRIENPGKGYLFADNNVIFTTYGLNYYFPARTFDVNTYVCEDGCLKRINSQDYRVPAFGVTIEADNMAPDMSVRLFSDADFLNEIIPSHATVTPNQYLEGYTTFYNEQSDFEITTNENNGVEAEVYTITGAVSDNSRELQLHKVSDGIINKGEAVLIKAKAGTKLMMRMVTNGSTDTDAYENNILKGVAENTLVSELCTDGCGFVYVLSCNANYKEVGFYRYSSSKTLDACKAYIQGSALGGANGAKSFTLPIETDIKSISDYDDGVSAIFDTQGRKVDTMHKNNIYIIDNKKTIAK